MSRFGNDNKLKGNRIKSVYWIKEDILGQNIIH